MRVKSYKRLLLTGLFFVAFAYLLVWGIMRALTPNQTYKAVYDTLDVEKSAKGIVLRMEHLVSAGLTGSVEWYVKEGDKVKKTQRIAAVLVENNQLVSSNQETLLNKVKNKDLLKVDLGKVDEEINQLKEDVYVAASRGDYKRIKEVQKELTLKMSRRKKLVDSQNFLEDSVSSFKKSLFTANDIQIGKKIDLNSPETGLITFQTDGFEDTITMDNLYNLDYDLLVASQSTAGVWGSASVHSGDPMVKIVDTDTWYLLCLVDLADLDAYEKNKELGVKIDDEIYDGKIQDTFENNAKGVVVVKMIDAYEKFQSVRMIDVRLVQGNFQGLKILKNSIITVNGVQGVYTVTGERKAVFRPIKILGYNEENAVIKQGYITQLENGETKRIKTVDLNSDIVINPVGIREGDTIH